LNVRVEPEQLLNDVAFGADCRHIRPSPETLIGCGEEFIVEVLAQGCAKQSFVLVQVWAASCALAHSIKDLVLEQLREHSVTELSFKLNWRFLSGNNEIKHASTQERATDALLDEAYPNV